MKLTRVWLCSVVQLSVSVASAAVLYNGDFETGTVSGWNSFTTYNGSLGVGLPDVLPFDTDGDGQASLSARFRVGEIAYIGDGHTPQGGGLYQGFSTTAGVYVISADLASENASGGINTAGKFDLYVDGSLVGSRNFDVLFGWIYPGQVQRSSISGTLSLAAGPHELRFLITRPWVSADTPYQYLDDVQIAPVPEPSLSTLALTGTLVLGLGARRRFR